jgi:hypothetical protein
MAIDVEVTDGHAYKEIQLKAEKEREEQKQGPWIISGLDLHRKATQPKTVNQLT